MTFRTDVTVDWAVSPRIIKVATPSTEITCQDIVDTCRQLEAELIALDDDYLIHDKTGGKIEVGTMTTIIVLVLNNAKIKFAARLGPTWVNCYITEGTIGAVDALGAMMDPREPSAFVNTDISQATTGAIITTGGSALTPEEHNQLMATSLDTTVQQIREGNMRRRYYKAVAPDPIRHVAVGKLDRVVIDHKLDADPDWSAPELTQTLWAWYETLGDDTPRLVGEDG